MSASAFRGRMVLESLVVEVAGGYKQPDEGTGKDLQSFVRAVIIFNQ